MPWVWAVVSGSLSHSTVTAGSTAGRATSRNASTIQRFLAWLGVPASGTGPRRSRACRCSSAGWLYS